LPLVFAAGCARPVPLAGKEDLSVPAGPKSDLAGVDLSGADLSHTPANCGSGEHDCNGMCISDQLCCTGADCPQYANSTAVCMGGTCGYMCNMGFKDCNGTCRSTQLCCTDMDCPSVPNTMAMHCSTTGMCSIMTCNNGFSDLDRMVANGCECQDGGKAQDCATATILGSVAIGTTQMVVGNLPGTMVSNWFNVTFPGNTSAGFHPHIVLSGNPGNQFYIDVVRDCMETTQACGTEAAATANVITDWEVKQTGGDPGSKTYAAAPPVGINGNVRVHVYRAPGGNATCDNYTLTISN
jgi:hypothetical protein